MILPTYVSPKNSLYHRGAQVIKVLHDCGEVHIVELYENIKKQDDKLSFSLFVLTLDWLYLAALIEYHDGKIKLCL